MNKPSIIDQEQTITHYNTQINELIPIYKVHPSFYELTEKEQEIIIREQIKLKEESDRKSKIHIKEVR